MERTITPRLTSTQLDYIASKVAEIVLKKIQPPDTLMNLRECAEFLGMTQDAVLRQAQRGQLPGHKHCRKWRFSRNEILEAIKNDTAAAD